MYAIHWLQRDTQINLPENPVVPYSTFAFYHEKYKWNIFNKIINEYSRKQHTVHVLLKLLLTI